MFFFKIRSTKSKDFIEMVSDEPSNFQFASHPQEWNKNKIKNNNQQIDDFTSWLFILFWFLCCRGSCVFFLLQKSLDRCSYNFLAFYRHKTEMISSVYFYFIPVYQILTRAFEISYLCFEAVFVFWGCN